MKKLLIASNILLLGVISFQACDKKQRNKTTNLTDDSTISCSNQFCNDYRNVELQGRIDARNIQELSESYAGDIGKGFIKGDTNSRDALSVVFDIEKIKTLIYQIHF